MTRILAACALLLLAACGGTEVTTRGGTTDLRPDANGLAIAGNPLRIDFGRAQDGVLTAVTRVLGAPPANSMTNPECGAGPLQIVQYDRITLLFQTGNFVGWTTDDPRVAAANGLSAGVTRAQLENGGYGPFQPTTLGVEFEADGIYGLLPDNDAATPIDTLWAGTTCFFR
ncbi:hypothetical protein [Psychromarinibacter halotolerans]|uniref:Uncharacterized protein n=1 Tax=Psychromarinibacter halotolerans TaxID=1775175 RepID=A0ABV7GZJ4_9RHOB|nr:hypothetical protein [Psychromarinibacter halotolerans]MDF0596464.1 hypothetical protein [Psychromarinibacter halotolerans]